MIPLAVLLVCWAGAAAAGFEAPAGTGPSVAASTATTGIRGWVHERGSRAALAAASVSLPDHPHLYADTRPDGTFELAPLATGYYRVRALLPDYRTAELPRVRVREGAWTKIEIALERAGLAALEMVSEAKRERRQVATQALRREELQRVPGTFGDPVKALQSLPGVGTPNQFLGLLIVQGGGPQDNLLYLDHTPMDYPYHFLGLVSVLHPDVVRGMDLASAGFGPSEGRVTGSVLSIESRPPRHDRFGGSADVNPILPNLLLEGPIAGTSWLVAGRRSYLDLITRSQNVPVNAAFWDYQARGDIPIGKVEGEALAYGADDQISVSGTFRNSTQPIRFSLHNRFDTQGAGASWHAGGSRVRVTAAHTRTTQGYDYGGVLSLTAEADRTGGRADWTHDADGPVRPQRLAAGVEGEAAGLSAEGYLPKRGLGGAAFRRSTATIETQSLRVELQSGYGAAYVEDRVDLGRGFAVVPGVRAERVGLTGETLALPRAQASWRVREGTELRAGWGLYAQTPQVQEIAPDTGNPALTTNRAAHYALSLAQALSRTADAEVQAYDREYHDLVVRSTDPAAGYENRGTGRARGVTVLLRRHYSERFFGWLGYTYGVATRQDRPGEPEYAYRYDQTHIATVVGSLQAGRGWTLGARWQLATGTPYTPLVGRVLSSDGSRWLGVFGDRNSARLPDYARLDLRVERAMLFSRWRLTAYLDMQNVTRRANPLGISYADDYSTSEVITFSAILPYLGVKAEF